MSGKRPKKRRGFERTLGLTFVACLAVLIVVNLITPDRDSSVLENRSLQQAPTLSLYSITEGSYMDDYESYLSDQFAGRDLWRSVYIAYRRIGGSREENGVFLGKKKQLLEDIVQMDEELMRTDTDAINSYAGAYPDTNTYMLLVPDAAQILPDALPENASVADQAQMFSQIQSQLSDTVGWIDGITAMSGETEEKLYYLTDHHWTVQGAYRMFLAAAPTLGITDAQEEIYETYAVSYDFNGSLASTSGFCLGVDEEIDVMLPLSETVYVVTYVEEQEKGVSLYDTDALDTKDQYMVFMGGNYSQLEIETGAASEKTLLLVKDSFANSFIQFLIPYYKEIVVVDPRYYAGTAADLMQTYEITDTLFLYSGNTFAEDQNIASFLTMEASGAEEEIPEDGENPADETEESGDAGAI